MFMLDHYTLKLLAIYRTSVAVGKKSNMEGHFTTLHKKFNQTAIRNLIKGKHIIISKCANIHSKNKTKIRGVELDLELVLCKRLSYLRITDVQYTEMTTLFSSKPNLLLK